MENVLPLHIGEFTFLIFSTNIFVDQKVFLVNLSFSAAFWKTNFHKTLCFKQTHSCMWVQLSGYNLILVNYSGTILSVSPSGVGTMPNHLNLLYSGFISTISFLLKSLYMSRFGHNNVRFMLFKNHIFTHEWNKDVILIGVVHRWIHRIISFGKIFLPFWI